MSKRFYEVRNTMSQLKQRLQSLLAQRRPRTSRLGRGMTLIEIMVVLVILGLIAGAIGYNVFNRLKEAQIDTARLNLRKLSDSIDIYRVENGQLPDGLGQLVPKIIKDLPKDPWQQEYKYVRQGENYDVYSYGPDKAQGGGDDIVIHGGADGSARTGSQ
jgi:general secretion pathway protein G